MPSPNLDDSVTELDWLQNFNFNMSGTGKIIPAPATDQGTASSVSSPIKPSSNASVSQVKPCTVFNTNFKAAKFKQEPGLPTFLPSVPLSPQTMDYSCNHRTKPSHSYATLIGMAIEESKAKKSTLSEIYTWVTDHFIYYKSHAKGLSWQNSIRHNLSLNKCFQKVARQRDEYGKGGFWRINPEHEDMFENGILKTRRFNRGPATPPPLKRIKMEKPESCITTLNIVRVETRMSAEPDIKRPNLTDEVGKTQQGSSSVVLHQDVEVGGVTFNFYDLLDDKYDNVNPWGSAPISPPASDDNSVKSLEDLLNSADLSNDGVDSVVDVNDVSSALPTRPIWWSEYMHSENDISFSPTWSTEGTTDRTISMSDINSKPMFPFEIDISQVKKEKCTSDYPCDIPSLTPPPSESSCDFLEDLVQTTHNSERELAVSGLKPNAHDFWNDNCRHEDTSNGLLHSDVKLSNASLNYTLSDRIDSSKEPVISFDADFASLFEI